MALLRPPLGKHKPLKEEWDLIGLPSQTPSAWRPGVPLGSPPPPALSVPWGKH